MKLTPNEISHLKFLGSRFENSKTLVLIYNVLGFTHKINPKQEDTDFFLNQEIGEIFDGLIKQGITLLPYQNENSFIEDVLAQKIDTSKILVWNLSRQGSDNNQKSLITSFCDFRKIPCIGSTVYSMNLARHKYHFSKILQASGLPYIPTFTITEFRKLDSENRVGSFLLKRIRGSASRGMSEKTSNFSYADMMNYINNNAVSENFIIQRYISGYEIEVPVFQIDGQFKVLGACGIEMQNKKFLENIMPEELGDSSYTFYDFEKYALQTLGYVETNYIFQLAEKIAKEIELKDYGRIDFRVDAYNNYFCFDISSTPYVTKHSSPNFLINQVGNSHSDLLLMILGAFNSNIDNH